MARVRYLVMALVRHVVGARHLSATWSWSCPLLGHGICPPLVSATWSVHGTWSVHRPFFFLGHGRAPRLLLVSEDWEGACSERSCDLVHVCSR
jgi:hypothetical protein